MTIEIDVLDTDYEVPSDASDTNWAALQIAFQQALAAGVNGNATDIEELTAAIAAGPTWVAITPTNSWANLGGDEYDLAQALLGGRIYVRGSIDGGTGGASCGTLPVGRRPLASFTTLVPLLGSADACKLTVSTNGFITPGDVVTANGGTVTNGVSFEFSFSIAANP